MGTQCFAISRLPHKNHGNILLERNLEIRSLSPQWWVGNPQKSSIIPKSSPMAKSCWYQRVQRWMFSKHWNFGSVIPIVAPVMTMMLPTIKPVYLQNIEHDLALAQGSPFRRGRKRILLAWSHLVERGVPIWARELTALASRPCWQSCHAGRLETVACGRAKKGSTAFAWRLRVLVLELPV